MKKKALKSSRIWVRFPAEKAWILEDLARIRIAKDTLGFPTTIGQEIVRILEGYFTGIYVGKETDEQFLAKIKKQFLECGITSTTESYGEPDNETQKTH